MPVGNDGKDVVPEGKVVSVTETDVEIIVGGKPVPEEDTIVVDTSVGALPVAVVETDPGGGIVGKVENEGSDDVSSGPPGHGQPGPKPLWRAYSPLRTRVGAALTAPRRGSVARSENATMIIRWRFEV